jgi:hypothetical protein
MAQPVKVTVGGLLEMSQGELDDVFRSSTVGEVPDGPGEGTVLFGHGGELSEVAAKLVHYLAWQGKVFDREHGELRNEVTPVGIRAVVAKIYPDASWFDGAECIVLDYSHTSLIAHWIRDEIREIAPGLYLGLVFWDRTRVLNFALEFPAANR